MSTRIAEAGQAFDVSLLIWPHIISDRELAKFGQVKALTYQGLIRLLDSAEEVEVCDNLGCSHRPKVLLRLCA